MAAALGISAAFISTAAAIAVMLSCGADARAEILAAWVIFMLFTAFICKISADNIRKENEHEHAERLGQNGFEQSRIASQARYEHDLRIKELDMAAKKAEYEKDIRLKELESGNR